MKTRWLVGAVLMLSLAACGDDDPDNEGPTPDGGGTLDGGRDGGNGDGGSIDAGDAGRDAGSPDAAKPDGGGATDAGGGIDATTSDAGDAGGDSGSDAGGDAGGTVTFTKIYTDTLAGCATGSCHTSNTHISGLDLSSKATAYAELFDKAAEGSACGSRNIKRVAPGSPEQSLLVQKLAPAPDLCGNPMPRPESAPRVAANKLADIRAWISSGAPNN